MSRPSWGRVRLPHQQKRAADLRWSSSAHSECLMCGRARYMATPAVDCSPEDLGLGFSSTASPRSSLGGAFSSIARGDPRHPPVTGSIPLLAIEQLTATSVENVATISSGAAMALGAAMTRASSMRPWIGASSWPRLTHHRRRSRQALIECQGGGGNAARRPVRGRSSSTARSLASPGVKAQDDPPARVLRGRLAVPAEIQPLLRVLLLTLAGCRGEENLATPDDRRRPAPAWNRCLPGDVFRRDPLDW